MFCFQFTENIIVWKSFSFCLSICWSFRERERSSVFVVPAATVCDDGREAVRPILDDFLHAPFSRGEPGLVLQVVILAPGLGDVIEMVLLPGGDLVMDHLFGVRGLLGLSQLILDSGSGQISQLLLQIMAFFSSL